MRTNETTAGAWLETPRDVTHDNDECGNRVAPAGDPGGNIVSWISIIGRCFGKEPKLEQGFGHIPHAMEVKLTRRTAVGT